MATGILTEGDGSTVRYTFNNIDTLQTWGIRGEGIVETALPGSIDPWVYDSKSRKEDFVFTYVTVPTTYVSGEANAGTGTFMDQLADLMYLYRHQGEILRTTSPDDAKYWLFKIGFHSDAKVNAAHTVDSESGYTSDSSIYTIPCIIKDIAIMDVSPVQRHSVIKVSLYKVGVAIGF